MGPNKKNNYEIHILIDKKPLSESPYPVFFNNDTSIPIKSKSDADLIKIKNNKSSDLESIQDSNLLNNEVELANRIKLAVRVATIHKDGLLGTKSMKTPFKISIREPLKRARSENIESSLIKVFDIPPTIKIEKFKLLIYNYVKPESMEIIKATEKYNILIKFNSTNEAKKSLELSGKNFKEFKLKIENWIDFSLNK